MVNIWVKVKNLIRSGRRFTADGEIQVNNSLPTLAKRKDLQPNGGSRSKIHGIAYQIFIEVEVKDLQW